MFFDEEVAGQIKERFSGLVHPVKLVVFSQALEHPESEEVKRLIEELATLDSRLIVESKNFILDEDRAKALAVHHIPGIAILRAGADGAKDVDYGVRFFGLPMEYDFGALIDAIVDVSKGESGLDPKTLEALKDLKKPVHLQVFSTPT
jgi:alkyl hydroperoxide reductase subunit AhpF